MTTEEWYEPKLENKDIWLDNEITPKKFEWVKHCKCPSHTAEREKLGLTRDSSLDFNP